MRFSTRTRMRSSAFAPRSPRWCSSRRTSGSSSSSAASFSGALQLVAVAVALYSFAVLFQLVTLPVEFDASRRAKRQLKDMGIVATTEAGGVNSVLKAASWTYVAGALAAVAMLLYYLSLFSNR